MKVLIKSALKGIGYQIKKYRGEDIPRLKIMAHFDIDKLLDVGANIGQYSLEMRELGFKEEIISFEPLRAAYEQLKKVAKKDKNWVVNNYALGNENVESFINVSANSMSSSILNMLPEHIKSAPESEYVAKECIEIKKLDSVFELFFKEGDNIMLKIDTQGFERNVILGAENVLNKIRIIQLEMSVVPLYENEILFIDMINFLDSKGFELFSLENGFSDIKTGRLLQLDGIFVNKKIAEQLSNSIYKK
ncbi:MAG: FkbM family methyltransferase [Ginsengibacter sp.]